MNATPDTLQDGSLDTNAHRFGGQALERANEKMRHLRYGMKDMASRGMTSMSDSAHAAQENLGRYASQAGRYVAQQPLKSALIAAAVGAAVAGIIIALRNHRDH